MIALSMKFSTMLKQMLRNVTNAVSKFFVSRGRKTRRLRVKQNVSNDNMIVVTCSLSR